MKCNSSVKSNSLDVTGHFNDEIVMNLTILKPGQSMNTILVSLWRGCIRGSSRHVKFLTLFLKAYYICLA
jgi:hypothetical protein